MKKSTNLWLAAGLWTTVQAEPAAWTTRPQPNLEEEIANAPDLVVENVSQPTRTVRHERPQLVPNKEGGPDVLVVYYKGYKGPGHLFALDTNTGQVTRSEIPRGRNCHVQARCIAGNGKLYTTLQCVGGGLELWTYDPDSNRYEPELKFGEDLKLQGQGNKLTVAADGMLYGSVGSQKTGEAAFYRIDPADDSVEILGTAVEIRSSPYVGAIVRSSSGLIYAVYGKTPYRLIEFDPRAGNGRELATANPRGRIGLHLGADGRATFSIREPESGSGQDGEYALEGGALVRIGDARIPAGPAFEDPANPQGKGAAKEQEKTGEPTQERTTKKGKTGKPAKDGRQMSDEGDEGAKADRKAEYIRLLKESVPKAEAKARVIGRIPRDQPVAPGSGQGAANRGARAKKGAGQNTRGLVTLDSSKLDPSVNEDGKGRLRYRVAGDADWRVAVFDPPLYAEALVQLTALPDGRVFGTATNRAGHFVHDSGSDKTTFLGRTGLQHHSSAVSGNRIYLSGYPSSMLWSYDFSGVDWVEPRARKPGVGSFGKSQPTDNPRLLGALREYSGVHMATCSATDSAGRVYFAGRWYRDGKGGGVGWWDPAKEEAGGFWEDLSTLQVVDACSVGEGRFVVLSTLLVPDPVLKEDTPEAAMLCIIDSTASPSAIARRIVPLPGAVSTGLIAPAGGNRLIGLAQSPDDGSRWILYGVDVAAGEVAWTKDFPGIPEGKIGGVGLLHTYRNALAVGPHGGIWLKHLGALLRIDPETAHVEVVGRPVLGPDALAGLDALPEVDRREIRKMGMLKADGAPATIGRMAFSGDDLYLTGTPWLRRIRGVATRE